MPMNVAAGSGGQRPFNTRRAFFLARLISYPPSSAVRIRACRLAFSTEISPKACLSHNTVIAVNSARIGTPKLMDGNYFIGPFDLQIGDATTLKFEPSCMTTAGVPARVLLVEKVTV